MAKNQQRSGKPGYDVEMIKDFLDHLLWEVRISHFEMVNPKETSDQLVKRLSYYQKKRKTAGLLACHQITKGEYLKSDVAAMVDAHKRQRDEQLRHLEALQDLFAHALECAATPNALIMYTHTNPAEEARRVNAKLDGKPAEPVQSEPVIPPSILAQIPRLDPNDKDPVAVVKLIAPNMDANVFVYAYNPETGILDALVDGEDREYGSLSLDDIEAHKAQSGIYRDLDWKPLPLSLCV